jgi:hypothetical protein
LLGGIWVASFLVPLAEWKYSELRGTLPSQIGLVRGMQFFSIPIFVLVVMLACAAELRKAVHIGACVLAVLGVVWLVVSRPPMGELADDEAKALLRFHLVAKPSAREAALREALGQVAEKTPPGSLFLSDDEGAASAIRSEALRPLAHCYKDGALLISTDLAGLKKWAQRERVWRRALAKTSVDGVGPLLEAGQTLGARYLMTTQPRERQVEKPTGPIEVIYRNDYWRVVKIAPKS